MPGASACRRSSSGGSSKLSAMSFIDRRRVLLAVCGSNWFCSFRLPFSNDSACCTRGMMLSVNGVGLMPVGVRMKSGSFRLRRSRARALLTAGWVICSCSAARVRFRWL